MFSAFGVAAQQEMGPPSPLPTWKALAPPSPAVSVFPECCRDPGHSFHTAVALKLSELEQWLYELHEAEVAAVRLVSAPPQHSKNSHSQDSWDSGASKGFSDEGHLNTQRPSAESSSRGLVSGASQLTKDSDDGTFSLSRPSVSLDAICVERVLTDSGSCHIAQVAFNLEGQSEAGSPRSDGLKLPDADGAARASRQVSAGKFQDRAKSFTSMQSSATGANGRETQFKMLGHWEKTQRKLKVLKARGSIDFSVLGQKRSPSVANTYSIYTAATSRMGPMGSLLTLSDPKTFSLIAHPSSDKRKFWILISLVLVCFDMLYLPMDVCFELKEADFFGVMDFIIAVFLVLDVAFSCITGKHSGDVLKMDFCSIARLYARSWLLPDLIIATSTWLAVAKNTWGWTSLGFFYNVVHVLRLARTAKLVQPVQETLQTNIAGLVIFHDMIKCIFVVIISLHVSTCCWYGIGSFSINGWANDLGHLESMHKYVVSFNTLMALVCGASPNEVMTALEGWSIAVFRALIFFFGAWFTATLTLLTFNLKNRQAITMRLTCTRYLKKNRISTDLSVVAKQILAIELRKLEQGNQVNQEEQMLKLLPDNVQEALHERARCPVVTMKYQLLKDLWDLNSKIVRLLCHKAMTNVQALGGDNIFQFNNQCTCMYFVVSGTLTYKKEATIQGSMSFTVNQQRTSEEEDAITMTKSLSLDNFHTARVLSCKRGRSISEGALWTTWKHFGNLKAASDCLLLSLHVNQFFESVTDASSLVYVTLYARQFVKGLNESARHELSDIMTMKLDRDPVDAWSDEADGEEDRHIVFLSHYKLQAGTEATLMKDALERMLSERADAPLCKVPIFVDSENLDDLNQIREHVNNSANLVLLLTPGVLCRPWCLVEVVTAVDSGATIVPVELQRPGSKFQYPDENFYRKLRSGKYLSSKSMRVLKDMDIDIDKVEDALRHTFMKIALPFSPHKTTNVRNAELADILARCLSMYRMASTTTIGARTHYSSQDDANQVVDMDSVDLNEAEIGGGRASGRSHLSVGFDTSSNTSSTFLALPSVSDLPQYV